MGKGTPQAEPASERQLPGLYAGGHDPKALYGPDDLADLGFDPDADLGFPGEPPYTRGVQRDMYRGRLWTMRQYAGFGTADESNARYRYLLEQGQTGLVGRLRPPDPDGARLRQPLARSARSVAWAWPSIRSTTCAVCCTVCRSTRCRRR